MVKEILQTPTSIGGIPKRGVGHALALISDEIDRGAKYFIRSDISGFFTKIPRDELVTFFLSACDDDDFIALFEAAIITELANIGDPDVYEHRDIFPIGPTGVAQGSPLSPLLGNILLKGFDDQMNDRGIRCIRYIDDFILLGRNSKSVHAAFRSAQRILSEYEMVAYQPTDNPEKAEEGSVDQSFDFLGYQVSPGLIMPSKSARLRIDSRVRDILSNAKGDLKRVAAGGSDNLPKYRYSHTLKYLNDVIKGWAYAFQFTTSPQCMQEIDKKIDNHLSRFNSFVSALVAKADRKSKRRIMGVFLLEDRKTKDLPGAD